MLGAKEKDIRGRLKRTDIVFYEESHEYVRNKGKKNEKSFKGATSTLIPFANGETYKRPERYSEEEWKEILHKAALKGTAVHEDIQNYCEHDVFPTTPEGLSYIAAEVENNINFIEQEYLVTDGSNFASKIDLLCNVNGELSIIDIKRTQDIHYDDVTLQTSLYKYWFEMMNPSMKIKHCYVFWARDDKWKLIELSIIDSRELSKLVNAYLCDDKDFIFNPKPEWCDGNKIKHLKSLLSKKSTIEAEIKAITSEIEKDLVSKHGRGFVCSGMHFTYVAPGVSMVFDKEKFIKDHPGLLDEYMKKSEKKGFVRITTK